MGWGRCGARETTGSGATWRLCGLGEGEVPIDDALAALASTCDARRIALPPISLEWERAWHDELAPADIVLPVARAWLEAHVDRAVRRAGRAPAGRARPKHMIS